MAFWAPIIAGGIAAAGSLGGAMMSSGAAGDAAAAQARAARGQRELGYQQLNAERNQNEFNNMMALEQLRNQERNRRLMQDRYEFSLDQRDDLLGRIDELDLALNDAIQGMGDFGDMGFDSKAVEEEAERRLAAQEEDIMRAIERVGSQGQAARIRNGTDMSTYALQQQGELAGRAAQAMGDARTKSYEDALRYIQGLNAEDRATRGFETQQRAAELQEIYDSFRIPYEMEAGLGMPAFPITQTGQIQSNTPRTSASGFFNNAMPRDDTNFYRQQAAGAFSSFGDSLDGLIKEMPWDQWLGGNSYSYGAPSNFSGGAGMWGGSAPGQTFSSGGNTTAYATNNSGLNTFGASLNI